MAKRKAKAIAKTQKKVTAKRAASSRWSARVMRTSDAMDLTPGVFTGTARQIAASLKQSSDSSRRRKTGPFQSAMSMLNFEINRAGKQLSAARRGVLNKAKDELRKAYGRIPRPVK